MTGRHAMTSNAERREQVLLQMVAYLEGVVDATASNEVAVRVCSQIGEYQEQLDDLQGDMEVF